MQDPAAEAAKRELALADDAYGRLEVDAVIAHLSAAIRGFTAADHRAAAAMACVRLGNVFANAMGNLTASRAWFARARQLVDSEPPCVEQGWVAVAAMGCEVDDPAELLAAAELALDRARQFHDVDVEVKALADAGLAHVQAGRVATGMALLDEALALACGPAEDRDSSSRAVCSFFTACYFAADFASAARWAELLRRHGLIGPGAGGPIYLSSHCDSVQAAMLVELGRWGEAESVLVRSQADFEAAMSMPAWHPAIALADLRVRQGRFTEAEQLLLGKDQAIQALLPAARLHLARGEHDLARAAAQRGLRAVGDDRLRAVELLTVLVEAELAGGDIEAAGRWCADLTARATDLDVPALQARAAVALAHVAIASDRIDEAIGVLEAALDRLDEVAHPWLRSEILIELARLRDRVGDAAGATLDGKAAAATLSVLDVVVDAADRDVLDRLAGRRRRGATARLARDGKWWVATFGDGRVRLADTKGLRYVAELLDRPGVERHVIDLVDRVEGVGHGDPDRRTLGDAGDVLDATARRQYRLRIERLRADADDASAAGRLDAAEVARAELDQLVSELAAAFGLGGRSRRAASVAERARLNVTRAIRAATGRLAEALPEAGDVLDRRIRTGLYCCYEPGDDDDVRWSFSRD